MPIEELAVLLQSWQLSLRAERKSAQTLKTYTYGAKAFIAWMREQPEPIPVADVQRAHIAEWVTWLQDKELLPNTVNNRYRALQQWFNFLLEEEEIDQHPMTKMKPPKPEVPRVDVVPEDGLKRLLNTCRGKLFRHVRDNAIVRLFIEAGPRLSDVADMKVNDVEFGQDVIWVKSKGEKHRGIPFGPKTALALDKYIRARSRHPMAGRPELWLGASPAGTVARRPPMTSSGIASMIKRRCVEAKIPHIHPHKLRHTFATSYLDAGGNESDLQRLMGHTSRQMVQRYTDTTAQKRAREAHRKMGLAERL